MDTPSVAAWLARFLCGDSDYVFGTVHSWHLKEKNICTVLTVKVLKVLELTKGPKGIKQFDILIRLIFCKRLPCFRKDSEFEQILVKLYCTLAF